MREPVYLDTNATTPIAPEVLDEMLPAFRRLWGNPSSAHAYGRRAKEALETARARVAALVGAAPDEVIFTCGGTEADNAAVLGIATARVAAGARPHVVLGAVEHAAVDAAVRRLEEERGFSATRVGVDADGRVRVDEVEAALADDTALLAVMEAQNETGVLQPTEALARLAARRGVPFFCDAAQAAGKVPVRVDAPPRAALALAGHKLYGPKGVGALIVREGTPFRPLLVGAGHEAGRRAGTENVPALVGLGAACALAARELESRAAHLKEMRDRLLAALREHVPDLVVHGERAPRLPNTLSVALPGAPADLLVRAVADKVAIGHGAACHSGRAHVSPVLRAMRVPDDLALATLRLCVGRSTSRDEVDRAAETIGVEAARLRAGRETSPATS